MNSVAEERLLRLPEVQKISGLSKSSIYRRADFPKPIKIGPRASAWRLTDVLQWIRGRIAAAGRDP